MNAFLIVHPAGLCLFDSGQTARVREPRFHPWWHPFFRLSRFELSFRDEAAAKVRGLGYDPASVRWVVLSHLHTDHCGGIAAFDAAEPVVSRQEWLRAQGLRGRLRGYLPHHWPPVKPRLVDFGGGAVGPFPASVDLAGDGSLLVVPTPGHTPGHVGLLVRSGEQRYLLVGDMVHSPGELDRVAPAVAEFCRSTGVTVLACHDPGAQERLDERDPSSMSAPLET